MSASPAIDKGWVVISPAGDSSSASADKKAFSTQSLECFKLSPHIPIAKTDGHVFIIRLCACIVEIDLAHYFQRLQLATRLKQPLIIQLNPVI